MENPLFLVDFGKILKVYFKEGRSKTLTISNFLSKLCYMNSKSQDKKETSSRKVLGKFRSLQSIVLDTSNLLLMVFS